MNKATWQYVPKKWIDFWEIRALGYPEGCLLLWPEYDVTFGMFDHQIAMELCRNQTGKSRFLYYLLFCLFGDLTPIAFSYLLILLSFKVASIAAPSRQILITSHSYHRGSFVYVLAGVGNEEAQTA